MAIEDPFKLKLYNNALLACEERPLGSLTENRKPRRLLDQIYDSGWIKDCLEAGLWYFAMRSAQVDYDPSIEPDFGYQRVFAHADDFIRTAAVASDERFNCPLTQYQDEAGFIYADLDTIYWKWTSLGDDYGLDTTKWPERFRRYVELEGASRIFPSLSSQDKSLDTTGKNKIEKRRDTALSQARSHDAMSQAPKFSPRGRFANARMGNGSRVGFDPTDR